MAHADHEVGPTSAITTSQRTWGSCFRVCRGCRRASLQRPQPPLSDQRTRSGDLVHDPPLLLGALAQKVSKATGQESGFTPSWSCLPRFLQSAISFIRTPDGELLGIVFPMTTPLFSSSSSPSDTRPMRHTTSRRRRSGAWPGMPLAPPRSTRRRWIDSISAMALRRSFTNQTERGRRSVEQIAPARLPRPFDPLARFDPMAPRPTGVYLEHPARCAANAP